MAIEFYIDLFDANDAIIGSGPVTTATEWESTGRMDQAGSFRFSMPASDPKAIYIEERNRVRCKAYIEGAWVYVGDGIINQIDTEIADDGTAMLNVSGPDLVGELAGFTTGYFDTSELSDTPPDAFTVMLALSNIAATEYGVDWDVTSLSPVSVQVYARFMGESILGAYGSLAENTGYHFRYNGERELAFFGSFIDSGIRAVQPLGTLGVGTCAITGISRSVETHDLVTRVYPFGGGQGYARLNLKPSNRSVPTGYAADFALNYLEHSAAVTQYGRIDKWVEFKDISPISNTDADVRAAANYLFDVAKVWLDSQAERLTRYDLTVAQCGEVLRPGETIRVVCRGDGFSIDEDLNILEATLRLDPSGLRTTSLVVTDGNRWPATDANLVVNQIAEAKVFQAHPQMNANSYVLPFTKPTDDIEPATFRFRFGAEVVQLQQVTLDFQILPLESTVKSIGVASQTGGSGELITDPGGSGSTLTPSNNTSGSPSINTSGAPSVNVSGGPSTDTSSGPSVADTGGASGNTGAASGSTGSAAGLTGAATGNTGSAAGNTGAAAGNTGAASGSTGAPSNNNSGGPSTNSSGGSGTLTTGGPSGGDTTSGGRHYHLLNVIRVSNPTGLGFIPVYIDPTAEQLYTSGVGSSLEPATQDRGNHDHTTGSHTHDLASHTHNLNSHTHDLGSHTHGLGSHAHTLGSHTHDLGSHSHSLAGHAHDLGNHTHTLGGHTHTLGNHSHSMANHTHGLGSHTHTLGNHTHDLSNHTHSLNNHSHTLTPVIDTVYGIFRNTTEDTLDLSELEYRVNAGAWLNLSTALNVGGGWYSLDVTAALYNPDTFRPLQAGNSIQMRQKVGAMTILEIVATGTNLVIKPNVAVDDSWVGRQIRVSGTSNYNGAYTVYDTDGVYAIILRTSSPGPTETTGNLTFVKSATIDAQLSVRNIIQAILYL